MRGKNDMFDREIAKVRRVLPVRKAVAQTHRTSSKQSDEAISKNYYFSYQSALFCQTWIQVKDKHTQQIVACFMLSLRECNLKVPYFFAEKAHIEAVATWILEYMQSSSASILTTFQPELVAYFQGQKNINFRIKNTSKPYMIAQKFDLPQPFTLQIQDGDGDCAFT